MKINLNILLLTFLILICNSGCLLNDTEKYIEDLHSENVMVKNNAIYYLGKYKEERAVPMLVRLLADNQQKEIKLCSINALGEIGDDSSVEALVEILKDTDKEIRIAAVEAVGKIKDSKATRPLVDILVNEDIQLYVIWALGNVGDKNAVPALTKLLNHEDKYVRYNAAQSLKKIGETE